ncbi:DUF3231 family protein [Bacillus sp. ISL-18]|nr:DUF3231 family protein [Bacillus sp. ISL-18]MBT2659302.1 DUF3231 family protein [Bacillus sp. ISL-18]
MNLLPKSTLSSTEIATLWETCKEKTFILRFLEHLIPNANDKHAEKIMNDLHKNLEIYVEKIKTIFKNEGSVCPQGFSSSDVNIKVPKLFDNGFDVMLLRAVKEMSMGLYTLNIGMSYRTDVINIYKDLTAITQACYHDCTQYLLEKGILARPPYIPMPNSNEYINDLHYLSGFNFFEKTRQMDSYELATIHHNLENNNIGMTLMYAFSQVAKEQEVKDYFHKGMELSSKILKESSKMLLDDNISPIITSIGNATNSKESPFSDKLMMYFNYMLTNLMLGANAFAFGFTLRNDLKIKSALTAKDVADYANEGTKIMIKHGWLEKPPQIS